MVSEKKTEKGKIGLVSIPREYYRLHKFVALTADVMFVAGIPFLVTYSRGIKFTTCEFIPSRTARQLANSLRKVTHLYARGGFIVNVCLMDREFEAVKKFLPLVEVNTTAAREHVPEIESKNRRIKEKVRALSSDLVYRWIPTLLLIHMVYFAVLWLNAFPVAGESWGISPRTAVTRRELNWNRDCKACLGSYVEASVDPDITNTNDARTRPCVYLGPSGNLQGTSKCLDIGTNKVLHRRVIEVLLASREFIAKVEALGKKGARAIKKNAIKFLN